MKQKKGRTETSLSQGPQRSGGQRLEYPSSTSWGDGGNELLVAVMVGLVKAWLLDLGLDSLFISWEVGAFLCDPVPVAENGSCTGWAVII